MKRCLIILTLACMWMCPKAGLAVLDISVTQLQGGSSIRFGRIDTPRVETQQVRVRITSTDGDQYQVRQRLLEPIRSQQGNLLGDRAFSFYTLRGSNSSGSLYQDTPRAVAAGNQLLYTSTRDGLSDSFDVIYAFDGKEVASFGKFIGRILYSLEPVRGGSPQTVVFNVYVDTYGAFSIEVDTSSGPSRLILDSESTESQGGYIDFKIKDNLERKLDVYQNIDVFPQNEASQPLDGQAVKFFLSGDADIYFRSPTALERKPVLVCSLKERSPLFRVNFLIDPEKTDGLELGTYRGRITYSFEGVEIRELVPIDFEINIQKIFDIEVIADKKGRIAFEGLKAGDKPKRSLVTIKVRSNSARPYQVIQRVNFALTNAEGDAVSSENFRQKTTLLKDQKGNVRFSNFSPVKVGEEVIFNSDDKGSSSSFKIIYDLTIPRDLPAGSYSTNIDYALLEK